MCNFNIDGVSNISIQNLYSYKNSNQKFHQIGKWWLEMPLLSLKSENVENINKNRYKILNYAKLFAAMSNQSRKIHFLSPCFDGKFGKRKFWTFLPNPNSTSNWKFCWQCLKFPQFLTCNQRNYKWLWWETQVVWKYQQWQRKNKNQEQAPFQL